MGILSYPIRVAGKTVLGGLSTTVRERISLPQGLTTTNPLRALCPIFNDEFLKPKILTKRAPHYGPFGGGWTAPPIFLDR